MSRPRRYCAPSGHSRGSGVTVSSPRGSNCAEQLEAVLEPGYDAGQGYLLGRPGPRLVEDSVDLFDLMAAPDPYIDPAA